MKGKPEKMPEKMPFGKEKMPVSKGKLPSKDACGKKTSTKK